MDICVIGAGYVGLTTAAILADLGHRVVCVEIDKEKVRMLRSGELPIYEPELGELISRHKQAGRLRFSDHPAEEIKTQQVILIAVGTPQRTDGRADLRALDGVLHMIAAKKSGEKKTIVIKSTVPPGTTARAARFFANMGIPAGQINVVANPEFLREGSAVHDARFPDRIIIGSDTPDAGKLVHSMYRATDAPVLITGTTEAELIKYAANAFLATRISFMNEMARIADACDADILDVERGMGLDPRIGGRFLRAGLGFGGSCFPKDLSALIRYADDHGVDAPLLRSVVAVNRTQPAVYLKKLAQILGGLAKRRIAVWGLTFKPDTGDLRASQPLLLIRALAEAGCQVHTYDPVAFYEAGSVTGHHDRDDALEAADALIVATEWDVFRHPNWENVAAKMRGRLIFDARNCIDPAEVTSAGLIYEGVGRR